LLHVLNVVLFKVHLLWDLQNELFLEHSVMTLESVSEGTFTEWLVCDFDLGCHLTTVDKGFFPVDWGSVSLLNDVKAMRHGFYSFRQLLMLSLILNHLIVLYLNLVTFWSLILCLRHVLVDSHILNLTKQLINVS
jgi:hypothetical protein